MNLDESVPEIKQAVADDGVPLRYREWNPKNVKGAVICLHGIRSHGAWYLESCAYLCRRGYRVLFPDRRGSGINRKAGGGDPRCERWIRDAGYFVNLAARDLPGKPLHLLGVSWGGRIAAVTAARAAAQLKSVVFSTPGIASLREYPLRMKLAVVAALITKNEREFVVPVENPALFTDDPDEQGYIEEDELSLRRVTARFLFESRRLEKLARREFTRIRIPLFLLLAGRDEIVDNAATRALFDACTSSGKTLKLYERARHTLEFDACRGEYFEDLARWCENHG